MLKRWYDFEEFKDATGLAVGKTTYDYRRLDPEEQLAFRAWKDAKYALVKTNRYRRREGDPINSLLISALPGDTSVQELVEGNVYHLDDLHLAYKIWCQQHPDELVPFQEWFQTKDPDNTSGWVPPPVRPTIPSVYAAAGSAEYTTTRPYGSNRRAAAWPQNDGWSRHEQRRGWRHDGWSERW